VEASLQQCPRSKRILNIAKVYCSTKSTYAIHCSSFSYSSSESEESDECNIAPMQQRKKPTKEERFIEAWASQAPGCRPLF